MANYIVTIGHTVYEQCSVLIEAPNKFAALESAANMDWDEVNWNYSENETEPEVKTIYSEDWKELDLEDDEDVEGAEPTPEGEGKWRHTKLLLGNGC